MTSSICYACQVGRHVTCLKANCPCPVTHRRPTLPEDPDRLAIIAVSRLAYETEAMRQHAMRSALSGLSVRVPSVPAPLPPKWNELTDDEKWPWLTGGRLAVQLVKRDEGL